jgi:hypothetical protein
LAIARPRRFPILDLGPSVRLLLEEIRESCSECRELLPPLSPGSGADEVADAEDDE